MRLSPSHRQPRLDHKSPSNRSGRVAEHKRFAHQELNPKALLARAPLKIAPGTSTRANGPSRQFRSSRSSHRKLSRIPSFLGTGRIHRLLYSIIVGSWVPEKKRKSQSSCQEGCPLGGKANGKPPKGGQRSSKTEELASGQSLISLEPYGRLHARLTGKRSNAPVRI